MAALSACSSQSTVPETQLPREVSEWQTATPTQVEYSDTNAGEAEYDSQSNEQLVHWWEGWQDPVLNELLEEVLENNPSLNSAGINYQISLLQAGISTAAYRPRGSASAGVSDPNIEKDNNTMHSVGLKDRKSTRLNSSHVRISYAVFCLKKKKK